MDGYEAGHITIQVDEGGSNVDKKIITNITNDEINRIYQSELNSNPPIDTYYLVIIIIQLKQLMRMDIKRYYMLNVL